MMLVIILVVMVIVSAVVYLQMKGARVEALPVRELAQAGKKEPKREAKAEKRAAEVWDKAEVVKRDSSPGERKRTKKPFDPVAEGRKVMVQKKEADTPASAIRSEKEERALQKRSEADGFVFVADKKKPIKKEEKVEDEAEEEEEKPELNEHQLRIIQLRKALEGTTDTPVSSEGPRVPKEPVEKKQLTQEQIMKKLNDEKERLIPKGARVKTETKELPKGGLKVKSAPEAKAAPWAAKAKPVEEAKEEVQEEEPEAKEEEPEVEEKVEDPEVEEPAVEEPEEEEVAQDDD